MKKHYKSQETTFFIETIDINQLVDSHKKVLSKRPSKMNTNILFAKYEFLIHLICRRYISNKDSEAIILNAKVLQKIFQLEYKTMLDVLENLEIIQRHYYYKPGETSRTIYLLDPYNSQIGKKTPSNLLQFNKFNKICTETLTDESNIRKEKEIKRMAEDDIPALSKILETYDKNLKLLRINNKQEFMTYIKSKYYYSRRQELYYKNIEEQYLKHYKSFNIKSIDINNRIYSILTSMPRTIKNFLNIKFSIDISNSHPLLFNYFLINKLNISLNILYSLYSFINSNFSLHNNNNNINQIKNVDIIQYDIENIRNSICINKKQNDEFAKIPNDVWMYIVKTSTGRFWDDFKDNFIEYGLTRTDVKQTIFHEVFYSHSTSFSVHGKMFAKTFKAVYPNVYEFIIKMKFERKNLSKIAMNKYTNWLDKAVAKFESEVIKRETKHISNDMMELESTIFFEILEKVYARRDCKALTIHDAIIVLNTRTKKECSAEVIKNTMRKVYKKYNLYPQFSIDEFDPLKWREDAEREKANQPLIETKFKEIEAEAAKGKKNAIEIIDLINKNEIELIVENDNTLHFHRLYKHSTKRGEKGAVTKKYKTIQKATKKYL